MKHNMRLSTLTVCFLLLAASFLEAAPAYGPKMPERNRVHLGFQSYTVLNRDLFRDQGEMTSQQQFLLVSYGVTDWLSLDLKAGAGDIEQEPDIGSEIKYHTFLGGGYGFRVKWLDQGDTKGIFGFQHISIHPRTVSVNGVKRKAILDDWQFSVLMSHRMGTVEPYGGVRWSRMDYIRWIDGSRKRVKSDLDKSTGALAGFNLYLKDNVWVNIEGSAFDGKAVAGSINWHY